MFSYHTKKWYNCINDLRPAIKCQEKIKNNLS